MNLILDCERMKHSYTGIFEYCEQLGKALQKCLNENDKISYYVPDRYEGYFGKYNCIIQKSIHKIFPVKVSPYSVWHTTYQLSKYIKNGSKKAKKVLTIHDLNFLYEKSASQKINKYLRILQNNVNKVDHIIAISEFVKKDILEHLKINCPISVIYNGCNVLEFPDYNNPLYRPANPFLLSLGTVLPKKNFHVLPCLLKNNDYELIIIGKENADYKKKIIEEARKQGVKNRVKIIGAVSVQDKYWYLKNCTAFLFPSLAEGFGIPPIEAMHFGKPTFLSTSTSLPEIGGKYAYYFDSFSPEAMQEVFEKGMNHYLENRPSQKIKGHASLFNWEESALEYLRIYKSVLNV